MSGFKPSQTAAKRTGAGRSEATTRALGCARLGLDGEGGAAPNYLTEYAAVEDSGHSIPQTEPCSRVVVIIVSPSAMGRVVN